MMTVSAYQPAPAEASAGDFTDEFMLHVATVVGFGERRVERIAHMKILLIAALAGGPGALPAWRALYNGVERLVSAATELRYTAASRAYLQTFLEENSDLAG